MKMLGNGLSAWRLAVSIPLCYVAPISSCLLLGTEGPIAALLLYSTLTETLFVLRQFARRRAVPTAFLLLVLTAGAITVFSALDITPASAFLAWFKLAQSGQADGTIGYMFCVDFTFFSALFAGLVLSIDPGTALAGYFFVNTFISAVILTSLPLSLTTILVLVGFVLYRAARRTNRLRPATLISAAQVLFVAGLVSLAAAQAMFPNVFVDRLFAANLESVVARIFPSFPFLYNVPGYGHSFGPADRGGRPALTSRPVLRVSAEEGETVYLRTAVYDFYNGDGWALATEAKTEAVRKEMHTTDRYGHIFVSQGPADKSPLRIEVLIDFLATLPTTLDTRAIEPISGPLPPLAYGSEATGFVLSVPVSNGFQLLDSRHSTSPAVEGSKPLGAKESEIYLQTGRVSERLQSLARSLSRPSPISTIAAIRSYLANNYRYSLDTKPFPPKSDSVSDFLFGARTGYCVQFASAFTLLARIDGIPARYVTGFLVNLPHYSRTTVVTGLSAHAWSEVWLHGRGWITVEATPPLMPGSYRDPGYYTEFNPTNSAFTRRQLEAIAGARVPTPSVPGPIRREAPLLPMGLGLIGFCIAALILRALVLACLPRSRKIRRTIRRTLRRTRSLEIPDPSERGWRRWAALLGERTSRPVVMRRAARVILELLFADRPPASRDEAFLKRIYRRVRTVKRGSAAPLHHIEH